MRREMQLLAACRNTDGVCLARHTQKMKRARRQVASYHQCAKRKKKPSGGAIHLMLPEKKKALDALRAATSGERTQRPLVKKPPLAKKPPLSSEKPPLDDECSLAGYHRFMARRVAPLRKVFAQCHGAEQCVLNTRTRLAKLKKLVPQLFAVQCPNVELVSRSSSSSSASSSSSSSSSALSAALTLVLLSI